MKKGPYTAVYGPGLLITTMDKTKGRGGEGIGDYNLSAFSVRYLAMRSGEATIPDFPFSH